MLKKVYIASPYTVGDQVQNVHRQMDAGSILMDKGYTPFIPLLAHFQHMVHPKSETTWLEWDLEWLKTCDLIVRFRPLDKEGKEMPSSGADLEELTAIDNHMPVYTFESPKEMSIWLDEYNFV